MIIHMEKRANRIVVEHVTKVFRRRGLNVFVKNGDGIFTLAVFESAEARSDFFSVDGLPGIKKTESGNGLFFSISHEFVSAEEYFCD